jgi:hypothetical protein
MEHEEELDHVYFRTLLLIARFNDKFLELASHLRELHETAPNDFKQLIKIPQLGRRKGYYLVEIDRAFADLDVPPFRLNQIGWTKLQVIAPHVTPDNVGHLLTLAEMHTTENLKAIMRGDKPIIGGRSVLLLFTGEQFNKFSEAILKWGAVKNGDGFIGKEAALIEAINKNKE